MTRNVYLCSSSLLGFLASRQLQEKPVVWYVARCVHYCIFFNICNKGPASGHLSSVVKKLLHLSTHAPNIVDRPPSRAFWSWSTIFGNARPPTKPRRREHCVVLLCNTVQNSCINRCLFNISVADLGGGDGAMPPRRQKLPFALLNYSFTAANDAKMMQAYIRCLFNYYAECSSQHCQFSAINQLQVLLTVIAAYWRIWEGSTTKNTIKSPYVLCKWKCKWSSLSKPTYINCWFNISPARAKQWWQ